MKVGRVKAIDKKKARAFQTRADARARILMTEAMVETISA